MKLDLEIWDKEAAKEFERFLFEKRNIEKIDWTRRIVNTALPVHAIKSKEIDSISKEILKGNFKSFLEQKIFSSLESMMIYGKILSKLNNFKEIKKFLIDYANNCECWATCDVLKINIKNIEKDMLTLAKSFLVDKKPFVRRIGIILFFRFVDTEYIDEIFKQITNLKSEKEYYVNMAVAWFLCEAFIKQRDKTLDYLKGNHLNKFTLEKTVSKCQDSFRVSSEDKKELKSLKLQLLK